MAHVYEKAAELVGQKLAGDGECVALVKIYTSVGPTAIWRPEKSKDKNGRYIDPSNNADAFSVVK
ncbi:hypothetical protein [Burkholderia sp. BCC1047]|uniref:hypothetical protein n=1 Tax=Burkholderia sp. BCC1047 TaxID=2676299 RepID=UPI00158C8D4D|nr:hypothetical protein [Burkholderia sp. BCC1047]